MLEGFTKKATHKLVSGFLLTEIYDKLKEGIVVTPSVKFELVNKIIIDLSKKYLAFSASMPKSTNTTDAGKVISLISYTTLMIDGLGHIITPLVAALKLDMKETIDGIFKNILTEVVSDQSYIDRGCELFNEMQKEHNHTIVNEMMDSLSKEAKNGKE